MTKYRYLHVLLQQLIQCVSLNLYIDKPLLNKCSDDVHQPLLFLFIGMIPAGIDFTQVQVIAIYSYSFS
jgi:hypothetical protein